MRIRSLGQQELIDKTRLKLLVEVEFHHFDLGGKMVQVIQDSPIDGEHIGTCQRRVPDCLDSPPQARWQQPNICRMIRIEMRAEGSSHEGVAYVASINARFLQQRECSRGDGGFRLKQSRYVSFRQDDGPPLGIDSDSQSSLPVDAVSERRERRRIGKLQPSEAIDQSNAASLGK